MIIYQLHLDGKERAHHNFKNEDEALEHQSRLITHIKDRINEGQIGFRQYLKEAKDMVVVPIEKEIITKSYSIVEYGIKCAGIVRTFVEGERALDYLGKLREDTSRIYGLLETTVND